MIRAQLFQEMSLITLRLSPTAVTSAFLSMFLLGMRQVCMRQGGEYETKTKRDMTNNRAN